MTLELTDYECQTCKGRQYIARTIQDGSRQIIVYEMCPVCEAIERAHFHQRCAQIEAAMR